MIEQSVRNDDSPIETIYVRIGLILIAVFTLWLATYIDFDQLIAAIQKS